MANVTLMERPRGLIARLAWWYARRLFGHPVEPVRAAALHRGVTMGWGMVEMAAEKGWNRLDPHLAHLAAQASAGAIGCSWCIDFGHFEGMEIGVDPSKVRDVPRWRDSNVYDERERAVLEYAEGASATPAYVPEALVERLHRVFSEEEMVELAAWVALENLRSRFNAGLGLRSESFSDRCEIRPLAARS
ncbi:MAG: carboxymuconolactone decarboxylase family protein [Actinomycetota bacterium]|nr:carboxymuconolactone decarboxylase family protein [Actinomycetota bacterium]